jgi:hypothetical protein
MGIIAFSYQMKTEIQIRKNKNVVNVTPYVYFDRCSGYEEEKTEAFDVKYQIWDSTLTRTYKL